MKEDNAGFCTANNIEFIKRSVNCRKKHIMTTIDNKSNSTSIEGGAFKILAQLKNGKTIHTMGINKRLIIDKII